MKQNKRTLLLGIYEFILSIGAVYIGMMISSKGVFDEFPVEWIDKLPFRSWNPLGIIAILVFGAGNFLSALFVFLRLKTKLLRMSALMGILFLVCVITQRFILGEWYLATSQLLILSIIQVILCAFVFLGYRDNNNFKKIM